MGWFAREGGWGTGPCTRALHYGRSAMGTRVNEGFARGGAHLHEGPHASHGRLRRPLHEGGGGASTWAHPLCTRALGLCPLHEALHEGHHRLHEGQAAVCTRGAPTWASPLCTRGHKTHLHEGLHASRCCLHKGAPMWAFPLCTRGGGDDTTPMWTLPLYTGALRLCTRLCTRGGGSTMVFLPLHEALHEGGGGVPCVPSPFHMWLCTGGGGVPPSPLPPPSGK